MSGRRRRDTYQECRRAPATGSPWVPLGPLPAPPAWRPPPPPDQLRRAWVRGSLSISLRPRRPGAHPDHRSPSMPDARQHPTHLTTRPGPDREVAWQGQKATQQAAGHPAGGQ